jgi:hypothetical protein
MWYEWAAWVAISDPYNFKSFWDTNPSFNDYANTSYFDVTTSSGFSPYLKLQGEIFKTYTFVTYSSSSSSSSLSSSSSSSVSSSSSSVSSSSSSSSSS